MDVPRKPSSRFASFVTMLGGVALSALLIGGLYGVAAWFSPLAVLNVALTIVVAVAMGAVVAQMAVACVMPSRLLLGAMAIMAGAMVMYVSWGTNAAIRIPGLGLSALDPRFLLAFGQELYAHSSVEIEGEARNTKFEGDGLIVLWLVEAAVVTVGAVVAATFIFPVLAPPLCKNCRVWQSQHYGILRCSMPTVPQRLADELALGNMDALFDLPEGSVDDDPHIRVDVAWCSSCHESCSASLFVISYTSKASEVCLCNHVNLTIDALDRINAMAKAQEEAANKSVDEDGESSATESDQDGVG